MSRAHAKDDVSAMVGRNTVRDDNGNLVCRREIVATLVSGMVNNKRQVYVLNLLALHDLIRMTVQTCIPMVARDDSLQVTHDVFTKVPVSVHAVMKCILRIVEVQLSVGRVDVFARK